LIIGERLRAWREYRALSQDQMEKRTGFSRHYISRLENGHVTPTLSTLNRFARAFEVPVFHLVYEESDAYPPRRLPKNAMRIEASTRLSKRELRILERLSQLTGQLSDPDRQLLLGLAHYLAKRMIRQSSVSKAPQQQIKCENSRRCTSPKDSPRLNPRDRNRPPQPKRKSQ